ncbi:hypothetical protein HYS92_02125 [Candidatus Daviesbacteria bacterium]|nr:hypothetical protein [Candidatus Daviesbacteria bacterium]
MKILIFLFIFFLLPSNVFAQNAPCAAETTKCGQPSYANCSSVQYETDGRAFYTCTQSNNPNCAGTIYCASENKSTYQPPVAVPASAVCTPNAFDASLCRRCASDGSRWGTNGSDFGTNYGSKAWCSCAKQYDPSVYGQSCNQPPTGVGTTNPPSEPVGVGKTTPVSVPPITVTKIQINGQDLDLNGSLKLTLPETIKESDVQNKIDVTYSDNSTKSFFITFHYTPKIDPVIEAENQTKDVGVLVLKYFPLDSSGANLNSNITGMSTSLAAIKQYVNTLTLKSLNVLTEASIYHGFKSKSTPALKYKLVDTKEYQLPLPVSSDRVPWNTDSFRPDYKKMLNDINICDYVENRNVKQVWVWGYHTKVIEPAESNMSMGRDSSSFWPQQTYGDISNSERSDDLPICQKTYVLYNYNYERGLGEVLEDHGHHIEAVLSYVNYDLFWNYFVRPHGTQDGVNNCGWMHAPPNVTDEDQYNWTSKFRVQSACSDWKPDGSVSTKSIDCTTWAGADCTNDMGASFKVWWMQNLPGMDNGLTYQGRKLRNWWVFIGDFDNAIASGKALTAKTPTEARTLFRTQSAHTETQYIPPASLPHPHEPVEIPEVPSAPEPLELIDFNSDGQINVFDRIIYVRKQLGL